MDRKSNSGVVAAALRKALAGLQGLKPEGADIAGAPALLAPAFHCGEAGGIAAAAGLFGVRALELCDDISDAWEEIDVELFGHIIEALEGRVDGGAATNPEPRAGTSLPVLAAPLAEAAMSRNAGDRRRFALMSGFAAGLMYANPEVGPQSTGTEMQNELMRTYRMMAEHGDLDSATVDRLVSGKLFQRVKAAIGVKGDQIITTRESVIKAYRADLVALTEWQRGRTIGGARHTDPMGMMPTDEAKRYFGAEVQTMRWAQNFGLRKARTREQKAAVPAYMSINLAASELATQERAGGVLPGIAAEASEHDPPRPIENCYWVVPGRLLAGEYPRNLDTASSKEKLARLTNAGVSAFIDLTEDHEFLKPYDYLLEGPTHERFGIRDQGVPPTSALTKQALDAIDRHLEAGETVYVHCWGGVGRTGTIIGCWLSRHHEPGQAALDRLKELWKQNPKSLTMPRSPENNLQDGYVRDWAKEEVSMPDRYRGCLMGLAAGDAVGTTVEFKTPGSFEPVTDMVGGGPFRLRPGQWTDDTSMALCLAESLVSSEGFNARSQMDLYVRWWKEGYLSSTGSCFDIGNTTEAALQAYQLMGFALAGSRDPQSAGNGSLMRLAPMAMYFASDPELAVRLCGESSRTTHGARACIDACRYFGGLMVGALQGAPKAKLLSARYCPVPGLWGRAPLCKEIDEIARGSFKKRQPPEIVGSGHVVKCLEAALWAFYRSETFEEGCLKAVNLGDDADTTAAIYGQLAGAYYGVDAIPRNWREKLAERELISGLADSLRVQGREKICGL